MIFGNSNSINYWLASQCLSVSPIFSSINDCYEIRFVNSENIDKKIFHGTHWQQTMPASYGVRPVVLLSDTVFITGGSGTAVNPWKIG